MAITDDRTKLTRAFSAVRAIRSQAQSLQDITVAVPFDFIRDRIDQIKRAFDADITGIIAFGVANVNAAVTRNFPFGAPVDTHAALVNFRATLIAFFQAYKPVYDGLGNVMSMSLANGHQFILVQPASLTSLSTPLANIIAAAAPIEFEG